MDVKEISQLIDQVVSQRTGTHLNDVQKAIIEGSLQQKSYDNIGKECHRSSSLQKRYLLTKISQDKILFSLSNTFKEYLKAYHL